MSDCVRLQPLLTFFPLLEYFPPQIWTGAGWDSVHDRLLAWKLQELQQHHRHRRRRRHHQHHDTIINIIGIIIVVVIIIVIIPYHLRHHRGNFRNYNTFIIFLVIFAYLLPISAMCVFNNFLLNVTTKMSCVRSYSKALKRSCIYISL